MKLRAYQDDMLADLYGKTGAATPHVTLETLDRLAAYRDGLGARFEESLRAAFPSVERVLGHEMFHRLTREYAYAHPSTTWDLGRVGDAFAKFLAQHGELVRLPFVGELARLEQLLHEIFFLDDPQPPAAPPAADALAHWHPRFAPTVRLFASDWDVVTLHARSVDETPPDPLCVQRRTDALVFRRADGTSALRRLTAAQYALQEQVLTGVPFGEAIDVDNLTEQDVADLTGLWVAEKLLR